MGWCPLTPTLSSLVKRIKDSLLSDDDDDDLSLVLSLVKSVFFSLITQKGSLMEHFQETTDTNSDVTTF